ncbi:hypothetical protein ACN47E_007462 [Coniothyrium glycines]
MNQVILSDTNRTPIVQIITYFTFVTSLLAFVTHAGIKLYIFRTLRIESWFVLASLVFCIAQSVAVISQTYHGFGTPMKSLSPQDLLSNFKGEYAAAILLFASIGFSKLAIIAFVHSLTPSKRHRVVNFGIGIFAAVWMLCAILIVCFECSMPDPWNRTQGRCVDRLTWWTAISVLNIVTEVAIVTLELYITAQLHVKRNRKASIMGIFACRLLVTVAAIVQLDFFYQESKDTALKDDLTLGYWRSAICNQTMQCLAIFTTCLPYTKIFMEGFESGLMRLDDLRRRGEHSSKGDSRSYQLMDISRSGPDRRAIKVSKTWNISVEPAAGSSASHQQT